MRFLVLGLVLVVTGCSAIKRDDACLKAEKCDDALQAEVSGTNTHGFANGQGVSQFGATDPVFGDDLDGVAAHTGQFGNTGTCWQNADTAKPCIDQCNQFLKDQQAAALADGDGVLFGECGGKAAAGEGEGEGGQ